MKRNPYYDGPPSENFDGLAFRAPYQAPDKRRSDLLRLIREPRQPWPKTFPSPFRDRPPERSEALRLTFIGHASFLYQVDGLNILVDPVWADRASPARFVGPKRVNPPGIGFEDLPPIDAVLITHNHYDHLDGRILARLWHAFRPRIIAPLGNDSIIRRFGPDIAVEIHDWGDTVSLSDRVSVHLTPSYHWSARGLKDRRMALWCSYLLAASFAGLVYHVGDTAYGDGVIFRDLKGCYGAPSLAVLPIGAYEPRWFMKDNHVDPEEAVRIMLDCGSANAVGHHWGTFRLTAEAVDDPPRRLAIAVQAAGLAPERFRALRPGEVVSPPGAV